MPLPLWTCPCCGWSDPPLATARAATLPLGEAPRCDICEDLLAQLDGPPMAATIALVRLHARRQGRGRADREPTLSYSLGQIGHVLNQGTASSWLSRESKGGAYLDQAAWVLGLLAGLGWRLVLRPEPDGVRLEVEGMPPVEVPCACGRITGQGCDWRGPASEAVVVEWMPLYLRATHEAAGGAGVWPHDGSKRLSCSVDCAEGLLDDWTEAVSGVHPLAYVDEDDA